MKAKGPFSTPKAIERHRRVGTARISEGTLMRRSSLFLATALVAALAPSPVLAKDEPAATRADEIAAKLNDPLTQYAVAGMLSAMAKSILEMPVAPVVEAAEQASGKRVGKLPRDARVGDLAGTDHERVRDQIVTHVPRAMSALGAFAISAQAMAPELERMARQVRESLPKR